MLRKEAQKKAWDSGLLLLMKSYNLSLLIRVFKQRTAEKHSLLKMKLQKDREDFDKHIWKSSIFSPVHVVNICDFLATHAATLKDTPSSKIHPPLYLFLWSLPLDLFKYGYSSYFGMWGLHSSQTESQFLVFDLLLCLLPVYSPHTFIWLNT